MVKRGSPFTSRWRTRLWSTSDSSPPRKSSSPSGSQTASAASSVQPPARDEHEEIRRLNQKIVDRQRGAGHLLEVVEHQQQALVPQVGHQRHGKRAALALHYAQHLRDSRND